MIELRHLKKTYGKKVAVTGLSLEVPSGEIFAFLGPNGAGKTTTIKMMVGLLQPVEGSIHICGCDAVAAPREAHRYVGYVPDQPHLYDKLSGREFLEFVAAMYGMPPDAAAAGIKRQIEVFELSEFVDQLTENYSHGMKQRVVFASALLHEPRVLILDEPMVGLDPRSMRLVKDLLREKAAEGMTVFMSTHTLSVAEEISHRIGVISNGQTQFLGTVEQLREELAVDHSSLEGLYLALTDGEQEREVSGAHSG